MIILIHGEDNVSSRQKLEEEKLKEKNAEIVFLAGEKLDLTELVNAIQTVSLFFPKKIIIIENLFSSKSREKIFQYLGKTKTDNKIILWERQEVSKAQIGKLKLTKEILCQPPQILFRFLDSIGQEKRLTLSLFQACLKEREVEIIFTMLMRQFRLLIMIKDADKKKLSFLKPWQVEKFIRQAKYFTLDELIRFYRQLLAIDYQIKSGLTPLGLKEWLDIFLVNL